MKIGGYARNKITGRIVKCVQEGGERSGTKVRMIYICEVVLPIEEASNPVKVSDYDFIGSTAKMEELTEMEVMAWAAR
jgi:hypothetical protein